MKRLRLGNLYPPTEPKSTHDLAAYKFDKYTIQPIATVQHDDDTICLIRKEEDYQAMAYLRVEFTRVSSRVFEDNRCLPSQCCMYI